MAIEFTCPQCGKQLLIDEKYAGKYGRCNKCKFRFLVPNATSAAGDALNSPEPSTPMSTGSTGGSNMELRLAQGEISAEEYDSLLRKKSLPAVPPTRDKQSVSVASALPRPDSRRDGTVHRAPQSSRFGKRRAGIALGAALLLTAVFFLWPSNSGLDSKSSNLGEQNTQNATARGYASGTTAEEKPVTHEYLEAIRQNRKAAEQSSVEVQVRFAMAYEKGLGVPRDRREAIRWYRMASDQGSVAAKFHLGEIIRESILEFDHRDSQKEDVEAARLYREAAEQGYVKAQLALGSMYENGHGVKLDEQEAARWYMEAAEQENVEAKMSLGALYSTGRNRNIQEAILWYKEAAGDGSTKAKIALGTLSGNDPDAMRWYHEAAEEGDAEAQFQLGYMYQYARAQYRGVQEDHDKAVWWFQKAGEQGHSEAQQQLGGLHFYGERIPQDYFYAYVWFSLSKKNGGEPGATYEEAERKLSLDELAEAEAIIEEMTVLVDQAKRAQERDEEPPVQTSVSYTPGGQVPRDFLDAIRWYRQAAKQGGAEVQYLFAQAYDKGRGVAYSHRDAMDWYQLAAEQGYADAQFALGLKDEKRQRSDYAMALKWYQQAVDQGHVEAAFHLGELYDKGKGVPRDETRARELYQRAAELGFAEAQYKLGKFYFEGKGDTNKYEEAVRWYEKAADQGHVNAITALARCYEIGMGGVTRDEAKAVRLHRKNAENGNNGAQNTISKAYFEGKGVPQDYVQAYAWATLAEASGLDTMYTIKRQALLHLSPNEQVEAETLSRELVRKFKSEIPKSV